MTTPHHDSLSERRHPTRARLVAAAAIVATAVTVTACGSSSSHTASGSSTSDATSTSAASGKTDAVNVSSVTLTIGDQAGDGTEALLEAAGLINKLPFKAKWADFSSGPPMLEAMASGSVDVGGVGDAPPVFADAGSAKVDIIEAYEGGPNSAALLVPKNSPITSISQLKGKKIAVAEGSSADYHLLTVLNKAHLTVHDVTIDYLQPADALAALASGAVDAWDTWSPYVEEAEAKYGAKELVNGDGYGSNYSYLTASQAALSNPAKRAAIADFVKVVDQADLWSDSHPGAWAVKWAAATGIPLSIVDQAAKDDPKTPYPINSATINSEQSLVDAFSAAGLIPKTYSFASYADSGFNRDITGS